MIPIKQKIFKICTEYALKVRDLCVIAHAKMRDFYATVMAFIKARDSYVVIYGKAHDCYTIVYGKVRDFYTITYPKNPLLWAMSFSVFLFLFWAALFPLDVASYAQGQVIPAGQLKRIQHLEGGIIRQLNVIEGQQVNAGDVIAELEDVASDSDVTDLSIRSATMEMKSLRIYAQLQKASNFQPPKEIGTNYPEIAKDAKAAFEAYRDRYNAFLSTHQSKIAQKQSEIQEAKERLIGLNSRSKMVAEQVRISEEMLKRQLTNEYEHLTLRKEQAQIDADRNSTIATEKRTITALEEAKAALAVFRYEEDVALRKDLQDTNTELASLHERLRKPTDSQGRTQVRSPVAGSIMTLYFKNQGAVVAPGGTIATLVPEGESLLVEAKLPIAEVGYVQMNAPARLSIASGSSGFSTISAKVIHISPDAAVDEKTGASFYVVRLAPKEFAFRRGDDSYPLRPGVQITSAILTGHRSVLALLLEPFTGNSVRPLTER
jgi:adhesin transport system membrane fusion protein